MNPAHVNFKMGARRGPRARLRVLARLVVTLLLVGLVQAAPSPSAPAPHVVLVLYSGHALLPANTIFDTSFRGSLGADSAGWVESCSEYLDEIRFPAGLPEREVRSLQAKFAARPPDVTYISHITRWISAPFPIGLITSGSCSGWSE